MLLSPSSNQFFFGSYSVYGDIKCIVDPEKAMLTDKTTKMGLTPVKQTNDQVCFKENEMVYSKAKCKGKRNASLETEMVW